MSVQGRITALEHQRRRSGRRVNVFLDGRYAFSLEQALADELRVGQLLTADSVAQILARDDRAKALETSLGFLSYRPRSEREIRERLRRKGVAEPVADAAIERLRELRLVNDEDFARYWIEQRQTHRPRGERLLKHELARKGVAAETIAEALDEAVSTEDPVGAAVRAGQRKARSLHLLDERTFEQKLGQYLLRRGFDYETVRVACRRLREVVQ